MSESAPSPLFKFIALGLDAVHQIVGSVTGYTGLPGQVVLTDESGKIDQSLLPASTSSDPGSSVGNTSDEVSYTFDADEALLAGDLITLISKSNGEIRCVKAVASDVNRWAQGFVKTAVAKDAPAKVFFTGLVQRPPLNNDIQLFLSAVPGRAAAYDPNTATRQMVGLRVSEQSFFFNVYEPFTHEDAPSQEYLNITGVGVPTTTDPEWYFYHITDEQAPTAGSFDVSSNKEWDVVVTEGSSWFTAQKKTNGSGVDWSADIETLAVHGPMLVEGNSVIGTGYFDVGTVTITAGSVTKFFSVAVNFVVVDP